MQRDRRGQEVTRSSSEARKACVTPTDQLLMKEAVRICVERTSYSELEAIDDEDPA